MELKDNRISPIKAAGHSGVLGRDEMNLAEFPLAALADRVSKGKKTLVFEDSVWDKRARQSVTRRLTISASDRYGLPTALDDEVILGLVQLTRQARFAAPRVVFSRYELINLLGWRQEGKSYRRIDESLKRWLGVTLYYEKAWWDKQAECWIDAGFHLIEQISLARQRRGQHGGFKSPESGQSSFTWNEVVFGSFQAGYLKQLDMALYRQLRSSIAKRLFRFLDKRFYHRSQWDFPLVEFACEHIGVSRNYDAAQLRRCLSPAIAELERAGFLVPMPAEKRFKRVSRGNWRVSFAKAGQQAQQQQFASRPDSRESQLVARGVSARVAADIVASASADLVEAQLQVFDVLVASGDTRTSRNPAGFLVASIRNGYQVPPGLLIRSTTKTRGRQLVSRRTATKAAAPTDQIRDNRVNEFLSKLSEDELAKLTDDAEQLAPLLFREGRDRAVAAGNKVLQETYRTAMLRTHVLGLIDGPSKK